MTIPVTMVPLAKGSDVFPEPYRFLNRNLGMIDCQNVLSLAALKAFIARHWGELETEEQYRGWLMFIGSMDIPEDTLVDISK